MKKILIPALACMTLGTSAFAGGNVVEAPVIEIPMVVEAEAPFVNLGLYTAGISVGTLGVGLDVSVPFSKFSDGAWATHFNFRGNINGLKLTRDITNDIGKITSDFATFGDKADGQIDFLTAGLLVDYYPFEQAQFRLSAGAYYNANKLGVTGSSSKNTAEKIADNITLAVNGTIETSGDITVDKTSPYVGMGWGNRGAEAGWSWSLDIGVMYHGLPKVAGQVDSLSGTATVVDNGVTRVYTTTDKDALNQEFNTAIDDINQQFKDEPDSKYTKFYPVIRFGITYSF